MTHLLTAIRSELPEPYFVKTEQRFWAERSNQPLLASGDYAMSSDRFPEGDDFCRKALAETGIDIEWVTVPSDLQCPENEISVCTPGRPGRLVTVISVLSPVTKSIESRGRFSYLGLQSKLLASAIHLMEIDLLRGGKRATAIPRESLKRPFNYHIAVRDLNLPPTRRYSYPIRLEDRLPRIAVPLLPGEGYVTVELQPVFDHCYDTGSYRSEIDYLAEQLDPPLDEARSRWARDCIERWTATPPA